MSEPQSTTRATPAQLLAALPAHTLIKGRLQIVRSFKSPQRGTLYSHIITMPAPDPYSHPANVEVIASSRLGEVEADVTVVCRVGGVRDSYKMTDRDTGEVRTIVKADNRLTAVEC